MEGATAAEETEEALQKQQERLVLLMHAQACARLEGSCSDPECQNEKRLLQHLAGCADAACSTADCLSTK